MTDIAIADNPAAHRFELKSGGALAAQAEYKLQPGVMTFTHTEVLPSHEGQGFGSKLARFALDDARARGLNVVPVCEFIAGYIRKHPEYLDLVPGDARQAHQL